MSSDNKKRLLAQIKSKLQSVIDSQHQFAEKTKEMLDSLVNLHLFDPDIDMVEKSSTLEHISQKLLMMATAKRDHDTKRQLELKRELIELYKDLLK